MTCTGPSYTFSDYVVEGKKVEDLAMSCFLCHMPVEPGTTSEICLTCVSRNILNAKHPIPKQTPHEYAEMQSTLTPKDFSDVQLGGRESIAQKDELMRFALTTEFLAAGAHLQERSVWTPAAVLKRRSETELSVDLPKSPRLVSYYFKPFFRVCDAKLISLLYCLFCSRLASG